MAKNTVDPERYRVQPGGTFRLAELDTDETGGFKDKEEAKRALEKGVEKLFALQEKLWAHDRWALLLIFQAMDAAGKDSMIEHVMSGLNPQGCTVHSFKAPSPEELDHDFLWRTTCRLPARGSIGVFNRSYYEEVLVVRVHPEFLDGQRLPREVTTERIWRERFEDINAHELHLQRSGTVVRKFYLHVSKKEQRQRFLDRLDEPAKNWKFSLRDLEERTHWDAYQAAYEDMLNHTSTRHAPWYAVPADHKWYARLVVMEAILATLEGLKLGFPELTPKQVEDLATARTRLKEEGDEERKAAKKAEA